jgi:hypothetical protein
VLFCKPGNELLDLINDREFLYDLRNYQLLNEDSAPWSQDGGTLYTRICEHVVPARDEDSEENENVYNVKRSCILQKETNY